MSRHEAVSCDSCLKSNFRGRRYKCLICYDYDLCANCYEEGAISTRHSADHPMQCILTRSDFELYYGGEILTQEQPQSFTCPYCKKMGLSDATLLEHVGVEHTDAGLEVVCPVCAALPGGDPNFVTDDFAGHLTLEHRTGPRDLISFLDEPSAIRHGGVRRIPHSGRALGGPRSRRSNMHFSSSSGLSALSPSGRDAVDPIAELLSQLSGVRRGAPQPSQLQQLQMQLQFERQQVSATRQQLERLPRRQAHPTVSSSSASNSGGNSNISTAQPNNLIGGATINSRDVPITTSSPLPLPNNTTNGNSALMQQTQSQYLLTRFMSPSLNENEKEQLERDRADRAQFVQGLMLSTLSNLELLNMNDENEDELNDSQTLGDDKLVYSDCGEDDDEDEQNIDSSNRKKENTRTNQVGNVKNDDSGGCLQKQKKNPANSSKVSLSSSSMTGNQERRNRQLPPSPQTKTSVDLKSSNNATLSSAKHVPDPR